MNHHVSHTQMATEQAAKDPICGMNVDSKSAMRHEHEGKTYYFCSTHRLTKFQADPGKYATHSHGCCS